MGDIREAVRDKYGQIARTDSSCCGPVSNCCGPSDEIQTASENIGYTKEDLDSIPKDADLGLGCGNPTAFASLTEGETVVDLGSGGGIDCFLAAKQVGESGRVIGVDMTADMISRARKNAQEGGYSNVEFRLGEIEHLPVEDNSVDVIISNCVINLSPEKEQVFRDAYRVLKESGRLMVSDIVLTKPLPEKIVADINAYVGCISGALLKDNYVNAIKAAGFAKVSVTSEKPFFVAESTNDPFIRELMSKFDLNLEEVTAIAGTIISAQVEAWK